MRGLSLLYVELHRNARRTGEDRHADLPRGARLALRVRAGIVTLTIAPRGARVGDTVYDFPSSKPLRGIYIESLGGVLGCSIR